MKHNPHKLADTELSAEQRAAIEKVQFWLSHGCESRPVFYLFGYAGTGKTSLAMHIASLVGGNVLFAAYAGKAAEVLQQKGCEGAATIHQLAYRYRGSKNNEPHFELNEDSDLLDCDLLIVDEWSMVTERMKRDLISFGCPILALGDPAQLPPVDKSFEAAEHKPDVFLTEIHRQIVGNPILLLAKAARSRVEIPFKKYRNSCVLPLDELTEEHLLIADQVLVGLEKTRHEINKVIRAKKDYPDWVPRLGDRLVCRRNDHGKGILNGEIFEVLDINEGGQADKAIELVLKRLHPHECDTLTVKALRGPLEKGKSILTQKESRAFAHFEYAWALTVHLAQGSQWNRVLIIDESRAFRNDRHRWLYTAITRASEAVMVFRAP